MTGKIEEGGKFAKLAGTVPRVGQHGVGVSKLIEERMNHGIDGGLSLGWGILGQAGDEVNSISVRLSEDLVERVRLDLRELVLHIVGVHGSNLFSGRSAQNLDDFNKLVNA